MAKLRRPSQRTIDIYNQLVEQQNRVRKTLLKMHKQAEETLKVGRLPALVIPRKARKYRNIFSQGLSKAELSRRLKKFWSSYRRAKELFSGGLNTYLAETVMKGYMDIWVNNQYGIGVEPEGRRRNGVKAYSKEQIEYSDMGDAMEAYNAMFTHGVDFFMALLYTGRIIEFKFIYADFKGDVDKNYYVSQQTEIANYYARSPKARKEILESAPFDKELYTHSKQVKDKAKKKEDEDEE